MSIIPGSLSFDVHKFDDDDDRRDSRRNNSDNRLGDGKRRDNKPSLRNLNLPKLSSFRDFGVKKEVETRKDKVMSDQNKSNEESYKANIDQAVLDDFVEMYVKNKSDSEVVMELLSKQLIDIGMIMQNYYNPAYKEVTESMNNVIRLLTTRAFAVNLLTLVKDAESAFEYWDDDRRIIGELISLTFETRHKVIAEETKAIYMEILTDYVWNFELTEIKPKFVLSEDAALDLVIGVPKFGRPMTDGEIRRTYVSFIDLLINHGGAASNYLTSEHQKELFYYLDRDDNKNAIKAAAYCLSAELLEFENEADQELYKQYIDMLYTLVNEHDIEDIRIVLRQVRRAKTKLITDGAETTTVFQTDVAVTYDNIRTALLDYIEHNADAKSIFSE